MEKQTQKVDIRNVEPEGHPFHNELIPVYPTTTCIENITFWPENARNLLDFEILISEKKCPLEEIPIKEIITYLSKQPKLELGKLKRSIELNGVRVPLIILEDGTLLDGNRRYFACKLLKLESEKKGELPDVLKKIPVYVIKNKDINEKKKRKILAEANFVPDYKVPWTLDVKARVISDYYQKCKTDGYTEEQIYLEIKDVYAVDKKSAKDYVDALTLADEFVSIAKDEALVSRRTVQSKFVYFWEFCNKANKGRSPLDEAEISKVKPLFFSMMRNNRFKNLKQIEPMIRSVREDYLWQKLVESKGTKIGEVEALFNESKHIKSTDDKIRNFSKWLDKITPDVLTKTARRLIEETIEKLQTMLSGTPEDKSDSR